MESEKMKEIKEAWAICSNEEEENCNSCPYFGRCKEELTKDTLTLINELESKNEALQKGVKRLKKRYEEAIIKNADECVKKFCETTMYHKQEKLVNENQQLKDRIAELEDGIAKSMLGCEFLPECTKEKEKETAEKFYKKVKKLLKKVDIIVDGDEGLVGYEESAVDKGLTEIAKSLGVEIKE